MRKFLVIALMVALLPFGVGCRMGGDYENSGDNVVATTGTIAGSIQLGGTPSGASSVRSTIPANVAWFARAYTASGIPVGYQSAVTVNSSGVGSYQITGVPAGGNFIVRIITSNGHALYSTVVESVNAGLTSAGNITEETTATTILWMVMAGRYSVAQIQSNLATQIAAIVTQIQTTLASTFSNNIETFVITALQSAGGFNGVTVVSVTTILTTNVSTPANGTGVQTGVSTGTDSGTGTNTGTTTGTSTGTAVSISSVSVKNASNVDVTMPAGVTSGNTLASGVPWSSSVFTVAFNQTVSSISNFSVKMTNMQTGGTLTLTTQSNGVSYTLSGSNAVVTVANPLKPNTTYKIEATGTVVNSSNGSTAFSTTQTYAFQTAAAKVVTYPTTQVATNHNVALTFDYALRASQTFTGTVILKRYTALNGTLEATMTVDQTVGSYTLTNSNKTLNVVLNQNLVAGKYYTVTWATGDMYDANGNAVDHTTPIAFATTAQ